VFRAKVRKCRSFDIVTDMPGQSLENGSYSSKETLCELCTLLVHRLLKGHMMQLGFELHTLHVWIRAHGAQHGDLQAAKRYNEMRCVP
jgi:hypothetical protein